MYGSVRGLAATNRAGLRKRSIEQIYIEMIRGWNFKYKPVEGYCYLTTIAKAVNIVEQDMRDCGR